VTSLLTRADLRPQQRFIADQIRDRDAVLIVSAMGSGKTGATLTALRDLFDTLEASRVLVIAPLRVATDTWPDDIERWAHTRCLSYAVCVGTEAQRKYALQKKADITIINRENLVWLARQIGTATNWPWDTVIVDESSMFKAGKKRTAKTKVKGKDGVVRTRPGGKMTRFGVLAAARKKIDRIVLLTGTPGELEDLWGQIYLLDQGKRLGDNRDAFIGRWFEKNEYTRAITPRSNAHDEIMRAIGDIMVSLPPLDLVPDPVFVPVRVQLSDKTMVEYKRFQRTLVSELHDVEAVNAGVLTNKLLQFCIAEYTPVLTSRGWVSIQDVTPSDKVWDGLEWVNCQGSIFKGEREIVECWGVNMTPDHKVLTSEGWRTAEYIIYGGSGEKSYRPEVRLPDGYRSGRQHGYEVAKSAVAVSLRVRGGSSSSKPKSPQQQSSAAKILRLSAWKSSLGGTFRRTHDDRTASLAYLDADEAALSQSTAQGLRELRGTRHRHAGSLVRFVQRILGGNEDRLRRSFDDRAERRESAVQQAELPLGDLGRAVGEQARYDICRQPMGADYAKGGVGSQWNSLRNSIQADGARALRERNVRSRRLPVYDLINCGPRSRFVVMAADGSPVIVHNCNGAMYREDGTVAAVHDEKLKALDDLIEQANGEPVLVFYGFKFDLEQIRKRHPNAVVLNESDSAVKDWNEGNIKILLAHPASCAHGLNMQYGGHICIWFGLTWSLELYLQANARLPRPGQKHVVAIYQIIAEGTVDERVLSALGQKEATQNGIIEATLAELDAI